MAAPTQAAPSAEEDSDEEGDYADEDVGDMPVMQTQAKPKGGNRRVSVSAESMDPAKLKAQASQVTNIPKSPEVAATLMGVVNKSHMLRGLDEDQKAMIIKAFSGPVTKNQGEDIITQGDIGDVFYLLEDGSVDVIVKKKDAEPVTVVQYKPGDAFGELALMYNAPRAATCRVASASAKLWALDRVSFKVIVVAAAMQRREEYKDFLQKVPILSSCTENEILTMADALVEDTIDDGKVIFKQGEEGNHFYIVKDGTAICTQTQSDGSEKVVAELHQGNYFGEIALITSKPRAATVQAKGKLKVLSVDRATFVRVLGNLEEIMKRNMEEYIKHAAQGI
jgi:cAMP-dependent protein kinase regulator